MPAAAVAVIGMGCRLPGGIDSPERLWEALVRGDDLVTEIPPDRWDADDFYDPEPGVPGRSVSKWGAFLDDVAGFDSEFFGMGDREATVSDPQHRLLLETSWEAMEHAGMNREMLVDSKTGVFLGLTHNDYQLLAADAGAVEKPYGFIANSFSLASGRIAYALGLHGPALTVDTACSSGLAAIHLACRSLSEHESDMALAGGVALALDPRKWAAGSAEGMLSPTGRCHAFDADADGFVAGEGCAVVMLKRLPDALRDNDRILAVIRGTASNQDGRTVNIATPSQTAQVAAYRDALASAEVDPSSVGMVEAHGTGTPTGDPIEYAGLAEVYGVDGPCALASSKTNFGHLQSASGALGLMKAVLALQRGVVPQNLHFNRLPDQMAQIDTKLFVPQETIPWPTNGGAARRAAVSAYGVSGTNVHAILEQAPETSTPSNTATGDADPSAPLLFSLSSTSADELRRTARRLADWLDTKDDVSLPDLAYTLARRRAHRPVRTSVIASTSAELSAALRDVADGDTPYEPTVGHDDRGPVWVFSGQGSQWAAMGTQLLATEPVFAATVAAAESVIAEESGFSVTDAITSSSTVTGQDRVQPTLFTMQVALAATLRSYGVVPAAVIGHSLGEAAAAVASGALSLEDGARVVCRRSRLMKKVAGAGATASVELPAQQVLSELMARGIRDVVVAVVASPQSTVVAGAAQTVHDLVAEWEKRDVMARVVPTDVAFHSPQVDPILGELTDALKDITPLTPDIPFYSATLFEPREQPSFDARYWADNCRRMVRFATAVQAALEDGHRVFAELSPHPLLVRALQQTGQHVDVPLAALAGMRREQQLPHGLRDFVADTHAAGASVDFAVLYPSGRLVDAPLPTWTHRHHWLSGGGQDSTAHGACTVSVHPLLGEHVRLQEEPERHVWQGEVGTRAQPWLGDHQVRSVAVLPGAAYCEMALAAARATLGEAVEVRDINFERALLLDEQTTVGASASLSARGVAEFTVETTQEGEQTRQAVATLRAAEDETPPAYDMSALVASHQNREDGDDVRSRMDQRGLQYGPAFAGLGAVYTGDDTVDSVLAEVALPRQIRSQQDAYQVHPALLDACFQSVESHPKVRALGDGALGLPLGIARLRAYGPTRNVQYSHTRVTKADSSGVEADIDLLDEHGTVLLTVQGLRLGTGISEEAQQDRVLAERLLTIEWRRRDLPDVEYADGGSWLLISTTPTGDAVASGLTNALKSHGAHCTTMCWPQQSEAAPLAQELQDHLRSGGLSTVVILTGPQNGHSADQSPLIGRESVQHLVRIARELPESPGEPPRLYVVTRSAQTVLPDDRLNLEQAGLRGLMRVIAIEHPHLRATQIDLDDATGGEQLAQQLLVSSDEDETAWRDGQFYVARLTPTPLGAEERRTATINNDDAGMRLHVRTPGDLESMEYLARQRVTPAEGQIEVAVHASSINFADVLVAFGRYPAFDGRLPQLGIDFAGVVTAVGPGVTEHRVGDRVGGLTADGSWGTFITCEADLAATVPDGLDYAEAAALTIATATAWHGLNDMARIQAGDKVLIHSGTGGVGQAAIAIARAAGAEIFATAGNNKRRQVLRDMGIEHVYDSRTLDFADQIRLDTEGYGVDIVLNSVPGAAQRAGLELLAFGGRFVEIGKRDIYGDTRLGLFPFRRNLSFYAVDLALMSVSHPRRIRELLKTVYQRTADGLLPMPECTHYPLSDAASAIRVMSGARHTGKLVLDIPRTGASDVVVPPDQVPVFRADGSYLVTGGLGGLGLFLAEKMAAAGCGRIVLSSRSLPTPQAGETIDRIRATGADVVVEPGDIVEPGTAQRLVEAATATGLPLRGVLHAAAVIEDATLPNITDELVSRDWGAKVQGAWNLHAATTDQPLDWFCSFSSAAALVGSPGQGAYAAANSWLDAFTRWRRAQGLPATAIAWGAWGEIGAGTALADSAGMAISPEEGAYAFDALLRFDRAYTGYAPIMNAPWLDAFAAHSPFAEAFRSTAQSGAGTAKLRAELEELPREEWPIRLRRLISDHVSLILRRSVDPDRPLAEYGMDSLGALELRTRIEGETGIRISPKDMTTTIRDLAGQLCDELAPAEAA
ncbi:sulfolipid-1 biosynthesis phthioceranic/hydroxyphthioceranic acid synthase [Mycolicibacterium confluentis]|uniref:Phthioceranic/hydroxyphthioceranic acid synthase n=1 Tax=Mycolicibacterium confluentis TaxID=28047 RepID=A0A7I7Y5H8_9MYCO|nr:type I polyketide synthase [Mycolicibacterium confluentis]MCV7318381.1 type I polyketide synthase [Mycolicibacterium confluentis]BBZ36292.1 polyketide synthase [Mycolicibacterium confluentis]